MYSHESKCKNDKIKNYIYIDKDRDKCETRNYETTKGKREMLEGIEMGEDFLEKIPLAQKQNKSKWTTSN
jgi:hypothetical protein